MGLTLRVHDYRVMPGTNQARLLSMKPYINVKAGNGPPIFIQGGKLWAEGGEEIKNPPEWFWDEIKKIDPERLKAIGFSLPEPEQPEPKPRPKTDYPTAGDTLPGRTWACPYCGRELNSRGKFQHVLRSHGREAWDKYKAGIEAMKDGDDR